MRNDKFTLLVTLFLALLFTACDKNGEADTVNADTKKIDNVGEWIIYTDTKFGEEKLEFFSDETCSIEIVTQGLAEGLTRKHVTKRFGCHWAVLDDGRVKLTIQMPPAEQVAFVTVDDDRLSLDDGEKKTKWIRATSNDAQNIKIAIDAWNKKVNLMMRSRVK